MNKRVMSFLLKFMTLFLLLENKGNDIIKKDTKEELEMIQKKS